MRSASRIVDSRWAITNAVRPASSLRSAPSICRSVRDVHGRRGLVEDQDPRVGQQRPREGDELPLAEREPEAALAELGVVAVGQPLDERRRHRPRAAAASTSSRDASGRPNAMFSRDRAGEEEALLRHDAELAAQRLLA